MTCRSIGHFPHLFQLSLAACLVACGSSGAAQHHSRETGLTQTQLYYLLVTEPNLQLTELGQISDDAHTLERVFLSPAHSQARHQIKHWMHAAGLRTWVDQVANVHGRVNARDSTALALVMGSHYDTVKDAGKFDGALGILVAIAAVKATLVQRATQAGLLTSLEVDSIIAGEALLPDLVNASHISQLFSTPLEVIAFSDEEGVRFQTTFLGSRAVVGSLVQPSNLLKQAGPDGVSVEEVLRQQGFDPSLVQGTAMRPDQVKGYVEVHLEQGPVLEVGGHPLGVVSSIAGQTRLAVSMLGTQGHAGTVPMSIRRDPLAAAAEGIYRIEQRCRHGKPDSAAQGSLHRPAAAAIDEESALVCTVGSIAVWPGASNVIAGSANFSIDIRAPSDVGRAAVVSDVLTLIHSVCDQRGLQCGVGRVHDAEAVQCSQGVVQDLVSAVTASEKVFETCKLSASGASQQPDNTSASPLQHAAKGNIDSASSNSPDANPGEASNTCQVDLSGSPDGANVDVNAPNDIDSHKRQSYISSDEEDAQLGQHAAELRQGQAAAAAAEDGEEHDQAAAALQRGPAEVPVLVSGAGHDGLALANLTEIGMLFVRCRGGISHSPLEHVSDDDVGRATAALFTYLESQA